MQGCKHSNAHAQWLLQLSDLNKNQKSSTIFHVILQYQISWKSIQQLWIVNTNKWMEQFWNRYCCQPQQSSISFFNVCYMPQSCRSHSDIKMHDFKTQNKMHIYIFIYLWHLTNCTSHYNLYVALEYKHSIHASYVVLYCNLLLYLKVVKISYVSLNSLLPAVLVENH